MMTNSSQPIERTLSLEELHPDPHRQFEAWYLDAQEQSRLDYPDSVCLSTIGEDGYPEGRIVLLKGFDPRGFVFYTNCRSSKGRALAAHPRAALTFYWEALVRQIRVQGDVEAVTPEEADAYFASRPRGSQLGAWASEQSAPLEGREHLEAAYQAAEERFLDRPVPRPPHWSGFRLLPRAIEFWQEGRSRLHDRFLYRKAGDGSWSLVRLNP